MSTNGPLTHRESWTFTIDRDETDTWPDCPQPYSQAGALFRPEKVRVELDRDARQPGLTVTGWRLKGDGAPGRQEVRVRDYDIEKLGDADWLGAAVNHWRKILGLGPGVTGVDWS
jgi:hypothetical protein